MKTATKPNAKRVACVGEDDPPYVAGIVRELEQLGMTARHMSVFSLRLAPRPPDLTVLLGSAVKDGGAEVVDQLGKDRGPYAAVIGPGGLAARLEARQRGIFVLPRAERAEEMARALAKLVREIEAGTASASGPVPAPSRPPAAVAVDGLDWDDDDQAETVNKPEPVAWRKTPAPPLKPPPPPPPPRPFGERTTLPGPASSPGLLTFDEVTTPGGPITAELQRELARPETSEAEASTLEDGNVETQEARDDAAAGKPADEVLDDGRLTDSRGAVDDAPALDARADPDVTAPQAALFEPAHSADVTAPNAAITDEVPTDAAAPTPAPPAQLASGPAPAARITPATLVMEGVSLPGPPPPSAPLLVPQQHAPLRREEKKSGLGLALGLIGVLGVLVLGGSAGAYYFYLRSAPQPETAAAEPQPAATPLPASPQVALAVEASPVEAEAAPAEPTPAAEVSAARAATEPAPAQATAEAVPAQAAPEPAPAEPAPAQAAPEAALTPEQARAQSDVVIDEAVAHERAGRLAEAAAAFARAAAIHDLNPHAHAGLARVAIAGGDPERAVGHAERAARLRRRRPEYQVLLGDARRAAGDAAGARRAYQRALELDPTHRTARERLGGAGEDG